MESHRSTPTQTYTIEKDMVYGFFKIKPSRGRLPTELEGMFTEIQRAELAIANYTRQKD